MKSIPSVFIEYLQCLWAAGSVSPTRIIAESRTAVVATCFLLFVLVAGVYGVATTSRKMLFVQAVPATLGLLALFLREYFFESKLNYTVSTRLATSPPQQLPDMSLVAQRPSALNA